MPKPRVLGADAISEANKLLSEGKTLREVAVFLGISIPGVQRYQEYGSLLPCIGNHGGANKWMHSPWKERRIEAQSMLDDGISIASVAAHYKVSHTTVARWIEKGVLSRVCSHRTIKPIEPNPLALVADVLVECGARSLEIASRLNVHSSTVGRWRAKRQIRRKNVARKGPGALKLARKQHSLAQTMLDSGVSCVSIADKISVDPTTIRRWITSKHLVRR
jgi:transposase